MPSTRAAARNPEDLTRLFVDLVNAGDVDALAGLYAPDAVLAFPPGAVTVGREAITAVLRELVEHGPRPFPAEDPLPTIRAGDIALTSTRSTDGKGTRVQVVRREPDGSWVRVIDRPELAD